MIPAFMTDPPGLHSKYAVPADLSFFRTFLASLPYCLPMETMNPNGIPPDSSLLFFHEISPLCQRLPDLIQCLF